MSYREPGVYVELINARPNTGFTPALVPLIVGEGPAFFDYDGKKITRSASAITSPAGASDAIVTVTDDTVSGGLTAATAYSFKVTYFNESGETAPATVGTFTTGSGKTAVKVTLKAGVNLPANATGAKVYFGTSAANVKLAGEITATAGTLSITTVPTVTVAPPVTNTTSLTDVLPSGAVTQISRVYKIVGGVEVEIPATGNYALTQPNLLVWTDGGPNVPTPGSYYYVDFEARPKGTQYEPAFVSNFEDLATAYGGQFMKTTTGGAVKTINPVYLGAYTALEAGAPGVYVLQVEPATKTGGTAYQVNIATDITKALDRASFIESAYFVVPMTSDSTAIGAVITHCTANSTVEERKERVCFVNPGIAEPVDSSGIFSSLELDAAIAKFGSYQNKRVRAPFVTKATKLLSDGKTYDLGAEYVCAAMAGLAALIPVQRSLTNQKIYNFITLKNVLKLSRVNKNRLGEVGAIILEQPGGAGSAINIRHGLTTKMDNIADREHSIVTVADYVAKYIRSSLKGYIGVYNIDAFLTTKVNGTLTACSNYLKRNSVLNDLKIKSIKQDTDNPDTLLIEISLLPAYPCNYIDVKLIIE